MIFNLRQCLHELARHLLRTEAMLEPLPILTPMTMSITNPHPLESPPMIRNLLQTQLNCKIWTFDGIPPNIKNIAQCHCFTSYCCAPPYEPFKRLKAGGGFTSNLEMHFPYMLSFAAFTAFMKDYSALQTPYSERPDWRHGHALLVDVADSNPVPQRRLSR